MEQSCVSGWTGTRVAEMRLGFWSLKLNPVKWQFLLDEEQEWCLIFLHHKQHKHNSRQTRVNEELIFIIVQSCKEQCRTEFKVKIENGTIIWILNGVDFTLVWLHLVLWRDYKMRCFGVLRHLIYYACSICSSSFILRLNCEVVLFYF